MNKKSKFLNVLILPTGGSLGIITLRMLECLEKKTGKIIDNFDCVVGASIGSVVGGVFCSSLKKNLTYDDLVNKTASNIKKIFPLQ